MKTHTKITLVLTIIIIVITSCLKPQSFPLEPQIEFISFNTKGDSGIFTISFTDGDGDIGLNQEQLEPPFDTGSYYYYNLYMLYYEMMNGSWIRGTSDPLGNNFPTADSITFALRIENITPVGQNKALKGEIEIVLEPSYFNSISNHNDSLIYKIILIDRSLNSSNIIETPLILR